MVPVLYVKISRSKGQKRTVSLYDPCILREYTGVVLVYRFTSGYAAQSSNSRENLRSTRRTSGYGISGGSVV